MLTLSQRRQVPLTCNPARLTPAERRAQAERLDRLTARFAYVVMGLTALLFAGQFIRWALS